MNWNELKNEGLAIVSELAKNDSLAPVDKLKALQDDVRPLLSTSLDGIVETLPPGFEDAVRLVYDHGGRDLVLSFLVPLLSEELYQIWKLIHGGKTANPPKVTKADTL